MDYQTLKNQTVVELRALAQEMGVSLPARIAKPELIDRLLKADGASAPSGNEGAQKDSKQTSENTSASGKAATSARRGRPPKPRPQTAQSEGSSDVQAPNVAEASAKEPPKAEPAAPVRPRTTRRDPHAAERASEVRNETNPSERKPVHRDVNPEERFAEVRNENNISEGKPARREGSNWEQNAGKEAFYHRTTRTISPRQGYARASASPERPRMETPAYRSAETARRPAAFVRRAEDGTDRRGMEQRRIYPADSRRAEGVLPRSLTEDGGVRRAAEESRPNYAESRFVETNAARTGADGGYARRGFEESRPNYADNRGTEEAFIRRSNYEFTAEGVPIGDFSDGAGMLELQQEGSFGMLRAENCQPGSRDIYISIAQIRRFGLRPGDWVEGKVRPPREGDRYGAMIYITKINGESPERAGSRKNFDALVPLYPNERLRMESEDGSALALRMIDMLAPIGKGQRGMIVSPPKAGKTTLLKQIANAIAENNPEVELIVLLIDERPEEVTDMKRSIRGKVIYSTFDEAPENHTRVSEMVLEHAQRMVEMGKDVVVLMDSITRLARAYNLVIQPTGRSLSGGLDPGALYKPKRFFGAARNIENGGSLTIIATALVDTGSRMDDIIYEEFKGTGNMELHLDRKLSEKRIFPAVDMVRSGTRREELLLNQTELDGAMQARRMLGNSNNQQSAEQLIGLMEKTATNAEFFKKLKGWMSAYEKDGFSLGGK